MIDKDFKLTRRSFNIKLLSLTLPSQSLAFSKKPPTKNLITQFINQKTKKTFVGFLDLDQNRSKTLAMPYLIHSIQSFGKNEFLATAKGNEIIHFNYDRVIQRFKAPKDHAFCGHSSISEDGKWAYSSAIYYPGYQGKPFRFPKPIKSSDKFGLGKIFKISLEKLKIFDEFDTGGYSPHDNDLNQNILTIYNSSKASKNQEGVITKINIKNGKILTKKHCKKNVECPIAHLVREEVHQAILGVNKNGTVILNDRSNGFKRLAPPRQFAGEMGGEFLNGSFSEDNAFLGIVAFDPGLFLVWEIETGRFIKGQHFPGIVSVERFKDGFLLLTKNQLIEVDKDLNIIGRKYIHNFVTEGTLMGPHSLFL